MLSTALDTTFASEFGFSETLRDEELPVTMQVGMVGNNGIVLVGDVWTYANVGSLAPPTSIWSAEALSKITIVDGANMAVSRACDMRQAKKVSDAIATELSSEHWQNPESQIERIANNALASEPTWRGVHCLIALKNPLSLFKLECGTDPITQENVCTCSRSAGHVFAGDCHNPATFWATRYLLTEFTKDWTVAELIPLAVQIVIDAGRINSGSVRGLEIVSCDDSGFTRLSVEKRKAWAVEAEKRSSAVADLIFAPLPDSSSGQ
jgi:hypothetical protein